MWKTITPVRQVALQVLRDMGVLAVAQVKLAEFPRNKRSDLAMYKVMVKLPGEARGKHVFSILWNEQMEREYREFDWDINVD